jgi:hypothetical protein
MRKPTWRTRAPGCCPIGCQPDPTEPKVVLSEIALLRTHALILMPRGDVDATPRVVRECRETACAYGFEGHRDG